MPFKFSNSEYRDIHFIYGFCDGNSSKAVKEYKKRYSARRCPHAKVFEGIHRNLGEYGKFNKPKFMERNYLSVVNERILNFFDSNPNISIRRASLQLGASYTKIHSVLSSSGYRPYHYSPVQYLLHSDYEK